MSTWELLNSPIALTIVSFILGGILASGISAMWQRRSQKHAVRLSLAQEILGTYHEYIRYLRRKDTITDHQEFDRLHAELVSKARISGVLFGTNVAEDLTSLAKQLANVQQLRTGGDAEHADKQRELAYRSADAVIEKMFILLR